MAEFVRVMQLRHQICKRHAFCVDCPLRKFCIHPAEAFTEEDAREMETIVLAYADDHPIPSDDYQRGYEEGYILGRHNALVEVRDLVNKI